MAAGMISTILALVYMFGTYATADEVGKVERQVASVEARLIARDINDAEAAICMRPGDPILIAYATRLKLEYRQFTGREYVPPACAVLVRVQAQ